MLRQVQNAKDLGEGDLELHTLRQRLAHDEKDLDARLLLARLYEKRGLPDLALEHYRLAAAQFPDSSAATLGLARRLRESGEPLEALARLRSFAQLHETPVADLASLEGVIEDEQGRLAQGEAAHRRALAAEPSSAALHNNLGYNLLLQKKFSDAASEFRRALALDSHSDLAHNNLGVALASQDPSACPTCRAEALAELSRAAHDPAVGHNNLAAILLEQKRTAEARTEIEAALTLRRNLPAAIENLRLASEQDLKPAALPASQRVNLKTRLASGWGRLTHASRPHEPTAASTPGVPGDLTSRTDTK